MYLEIHRPFILGVHHLAQTRHHSLLHDTQLDYFRLRHQVFAAMLQIQYET